MSKWDYRFVDLAKHISTWSKDESSKVGAVIVDDKRRVVSLGFNGRPRGTSDEPMSRERKLMRVVHAEENALLFSGKSVDGYTIYVTHHPCANCAAKIVQSGIKRVVIPKAQNQGFLERWKDNLEEAKALLLEGGVEITEMQDQ